MEKLQKLNIVYEDDEILVVNKPAGLIVEPGAGAKWETLTDLIKEHLFSRGVDIEKLGKRSGLVHRLDKDTSGLMVIAKTEKAQKFLQKEIRERKVLKKYVALVLGGLAFEGKIVLPIGRHKIRRDKMTVTFLGKGREAVTSYRTLKVHSYKNRVLSLVEAKIETGRTHQIRVHFSYFGHPIIGDVTYGNKTTNEIAKNLGLTRQFLHAAALGFTHPKTGEWVEFRSDLPKDLKNSLNQLAN